MIVFDRNSNQAQQGGAALPPGPCGQISLRRLCELLEQGGEVKPEERLTHLELSGYTIRYRVESRAVASAGKAMRAYVGNADGTVLVAEEGERRALAPRTDLRNHSPTGFAWGYLGLGPAQLALAILADALGDERALAIYQAFKERYVAPLPQREPWEFSVEDVRRWAGELEAERVPS